MSRIGFSTGALAKGDFKAGVEAQRRYAQIDAIELSALRDHELPPLVELAPKLDLSHFQSISIHAPSQLRTIDEEHAFELLESLPAKWPIVAHPDLLKTPALWRRLGQRLCIENMDYRKTTGRTVSELQTLFDQFPDATFCLDLGHARQIDPTMASAILMLRTFRDRLRQIHISEVGTKGEHLPIGATTRYAFARVTHLIPPECPLIIESVIPMEQIARELDAVSLLFDAREAIA